MSDTNLKKIEANAYSRGYAAGQKRKHKAMTEEARQRKKDAFWQRAFLAALPAAFSAQGWKDGNGKAITNLPARIRLAANAADEAVKLAIFHLG